MDISAELSAARIVIQGTGEMVGEQKINIMIYNSNGLMGGKSSCYLQLYKE